MTTRKPLVLNPITGHPEQIQSSDSLDPNSFFGAIHQIVFLDKYRTNNEWLFYASSHIRSNGSPAVAPWSSRIIGLTFSNSYNNVDMDFEIYSSSSGSGNSSSLLYTWSLLNTRVSYITDLPNLIINQGDKIAIFGRKTGRDPDRSVITVYLGVVDSNSGAGSENYSGNLST